MALNKEIELCQKISSEVKHTFLRIYNAVKEREIQLLRQIEVLGQHCKLNDSYEKCFKQISIIFDNEVDILQSLSKFGQINFNGLSHDSNFFKIEDYQHPDKDHVELFKCVENISKDKKKVSEKIITEEKVNDSEENKVEKLNESNEKSSVVKSIYDYSTTNVMLECIEKQDSSLCIYDLSKKKRNENVQEEEQEHFSSCCSSPNADTSSTYCDEINDFHENQYDTHITNSTSVPNLNCICSEDMKFTKYNSCPHKATNIKDNTNTSSAEELGNTSERVRKLSMKQPIQVQQWMKQISCEPETEPAPNNVMEHSQIKAFHKQTSNM